MKKGFLVAIILIAVLTCALALAACAEVSTTVTYMVDGEVFETLVVTGTDQSDPGFTPSKSNYTFDGWYTDEALRTPFDFEAYAANEERTNIAVYAKWEVNTYNITYENTKGAENSNPATYNIESATITLAYITSPGYTFEGWFVGEEKVESIERGSYGDITLTAKWALTQYTATFVNSDGTIGTVDFDIEDTALSEPDVPQRTGYTGEWEDYEIKAENLTINAVYTPITYNITYENTKGAENSNPATYNIETATITLADITSPGYTFEGWFVGEEKVESIELGSYGDITLTAKWSPITYNITYENTKGAENSNPATYNIESATITLADITAPGYTFEGWFVGEEKVESIELGSYGDITLTAKWTIIKYSVNYVLDGGINAEANPSVYTVETLGGADGVIALEDPTKRTNITVNADGAIAYYVYEFLGWYKDSGFEQRVSELSLSLGNVILYAKWSTTEASANYMRVNENNELDEGGGYILFGQYPQTIKASDVTVGDVADEDGYYLGSDGERYAKVVADPEDSGYTFSDNSSVIYGNTYYFKVEPIRWRILSESDGKAFILCDGIIANKAYDAYGSYYSSSDIRAWLNDEFYKTAFGALQQALIQTTEVDNSVYSTGYSSNPHPIDNTFDKVFLLSYREVTSSAYGFASSYSTYDTARQMLTSDYSRATGAYMSTESSYYGNGEWRLRSSPNDGYTYARNVRSYGYAGNLSNVHYGDKGVVPALNLMLS